GRRRGAGHHVVHDRARLVAREVVTVEQPRECVLHLHAASFAFGSVARGKPCFPREPPSSSRHASARAPRRWARRLKIAIRGTSRFPITPSPQPLTRLT